MCVCKSACLTPSTRIVLPLLFGSVQYVTFFISLSVLHLFSLNFNFYFTSVTLLQRLSNQNTLSKQFRKCQISKPLNHSLCTVYEHLFCSFLFLTLISHPDLTRSAAQAASRKVIHSERERITNNVKTLATLLDLISG